MSSAVNHLGGRCPHIPFFIGGQMSEGANVLHSYISIRNYFVHRQQCPSLDRNFRNPFLEIPERLPVQPIQSDTQN